MCNFVWRIKENQSLCVYIVIEEENSSEFYIEVALLALTYKRKLLLGSLSWSSRRKFSLVTQSCSTLCDHIDCSTPGFPVHHQHPEMVQTYAHWVVHPTISSLSSRSPAFSLSPASGSFPVSQFLASSGQSTGASPSVSVLLMNIQNWFPFRIDWFDLLAVQGTLKSLLQHYSSKPSVLQCSAFFLVQYPYMTSFLVHTHAWLLEKPYLWLDRPLLAKWCLLFNCCLGLS